LWTAAAIETAERKELRARRGSGRAWSAAYKDLIDKTVARCAALIRGPQTAVTVDRYPGRVVEGIAKEVHAIKDNSRRTR
jgi:hypothetical protein